VANPQLIKDCAEKFGSQCVVVAIDGRREADGSWHVYVAGGRKDTGKDLIEWAKEAVDLGAGEILLTSMDTEPSQALIWICSMQ
jgi:cyclase